ncbi:hypothetical protein [Brucella sp. 22210]|uniref:hypothetical protein n=1 Tax=Brucella sp. 22210 TaxID=3453892 RepID=UPI003F85D0F3
MHQQITEIRTIPSEAATRLLIFALIACAFLAVFGQFSEPFISHDDFDWLIPANFDQGFESPWSKASTEGRWLNYPWSLLTVHLNINSAYYLFVALTIWMCVSISRLYMGRLSVIAALLFFFSPPAGELSLWPVTQSSSVLITAACVTTLYFLQRNNVRYIMLGGVVIASLLTYPAYAPMILIVFGATLLNKTNELINTAAVYVGAYAVGIITIFSLNWYFHNNFGIKVAGWRHSTPLFPDGDLIANIVRYTKFWIEVTRYWPVFIISVIGYATCFFANIKKRQCVYVLLLSVLIIAMEASASIINGLDLPSRTSLWLWISLITPVLFVLHSKRFTYLSFILAFSVLLIAVYSWSHRLQVIYRTFPYAHSLGETLMQSAAANNGLYDNIIVFGDYKENHITQWLHSNRHLRNYLYKKFGVYTRACGEELCKKIEVDLNSRQEIPVTTIIDRNLILVLSPHIGWTY